MIALGNSYVHKKFIQDKVIKSMLSFSVALAFLKVPDDSHILGFTSILLLKLNTRFSTNKHNITVNRPTVVIFNKKAENT